MYEMKGTLTNEPPSVAGLMNFHFRGENICSIAKEWKPHVLNVKIIEGLQPSALTIVALRTKTTIS